MQNRVKHTIRRDDIFDGEASKHALYRRDDVRIELLNGLVPFLGDRENSGPAVFRIFSPREQAARFKLVDKARDGRPIFQHRLGQFRNAVHPECRDHPHGHRFFRCHVRARLLKQSRQMKVYGV